MNQIEQTQVFQTNHQRFLESFEQLKQLFPEDGKDNGYNRRAFSEKEQIVHDWLEKKLRDSGIKTYSDSIGNTFGRIGQNKNLAIGCGSHIDTVAHGGLLDGAYGTLAALEVARSIAENKFNLKRDIVFTCFIGEEVNLLGGTFGSRAMIGQTPQVDNKFFNKAQIKNAKIDSDFFKNFLELHIEQSSSLENQNITIGIPNAIAGIVRYEYVFSGEALHAGATLMKYRKDALVEASKFIQKVSKTAMENTKQLVATIGKIDIYPNTPTVIPGKTVLVLEIRATNMQDAYDFHEYLDNWLKNNHFDFSDKKIVDKGSGKLSEKVDDVIEKVAYDLDLSSTKMYSGANHDVNAMSKICEAGLIFVPSHKGISHSPYEYTEESDLLSGLDVLYNSVLCLANE